MINKNLDKLRQQIIDEIDGNKFFRLKSKLLKKYSSTDREYVLKILIEYVKNGQILHWRNHLLPDIINIVKEEEAEYINFFEWCVTQPELTYWGIDGLIKTKGKKSFPTLIELAKNDGLEIEARAKSIKRISAYSKQPFDRELPIEVRNWRIEDLRIAELENWQKNGYTDGQGYSKPKTHISLENPKTELERIVSKLNQKLEVERSKIQDLSNPTNWLVIADQNDMLNINKKWKLPANYLLFLKNFSPVNVHIDSTIYFQGLNLYGASELIKGQEGYSHNPVTNQPIDEWPKNFVVIADAGADPFCIDTNNINEGDAPIYTSTHGTGEWKFELYADSFLKFLEEIAEN